MTDNLSPGYLDYGCFPFSMRICAGTNCGLNHAVSTAEEMQEFLMSLDENIIR